MRTTLWLGVILSTSALAACGGGGSDPDAPIIPEIDAPPGTPDGRPDADPLAPDAAPEFACLNQPIPTTAPTPLSVAGDMAALSIAGSTPVEGATVSAFIVGNPTAVATATTANTTGAYEITINNPGTTPVDGYLRAPSTGNKTVYLFPPTLIYQDIPMAPIRTIGDGIFGTFLTFAQANYTPGNAVVALVVADCLNNPLAGATASAVGLPTAQVRYNGANGLPSGSATETAADGIAYIIDVPPGNITVDALYMGMDFREHTFVARPADGTENAINTTVVHP